MYSAHSPDPKRGILAQDYTEHVRGVLCRASKAADGASKYAVHDGDALRETVRLAGEYHDLGKLDVRNQSVLTGKTKARRLPVQHADAGTAYLLDRLGIPIGAALVRSHHIGLPDFVEEANRGEGNLFRDNTVRERIDQTLSELVRLHRETIHSEHVSNSTRFVIRGDATLFFRIALSCLADGDHADTSRHYQGSSDEPSKDEIPLNPASRLASLDRYVTTLKEDSVRSRLRSEVYIACRNSHVTGSIASCDSPVGTGKTTAVMAHLLSQAERRGLRRIMVVLPFTNIIRQSVEVYRKALVLPGENPCCVVAELHHRADYQDVQSRQFTALWNAPIVVTTAVSFFETLAANTPATLRRIHRLAGAAVFVDESHAALPSKLLPLAWRWIKGYADEWGCYWVMASGSLNRFWKIKEFDEEDPDIPEIMPNELRDQVSQHEHVRVNYKLCDTPMGPQELVDWTVSLPGPRLVILNTVQSAAVIARQLANKSGRPSVEHLSTALTPFDRDKTLERVRRRLSDARDTEWSLVATSCVEAGVDLSFKTGVREASSLVSLLQTAGRVNRHRYGSPEVVWTVTLRDMPPLKQHPGTSDSAKVLLQLFSTETTISSALCTTALQREIRRVGSFSNALLKLEELMQFPQVEQNFRVIASDTRTVVVDPEIIQKIETYCPVTWQEIQALSVQLWGYRLQDLRLPEVKGHPGMYKWTYAYDDFIGCMAGILSVEDVRYNFGGASII